MKQCNRCHQTKARSEFYLSHKEKDGLQRGCKTCLLLMQSEKRERIRWGVQVPKKKLVHPKGKKICTRCQETKPANSKHFEALATGERGLFPECRECRRALKRTYVHGLPWAKRLISYVNGPRHTSRTDEPLDLTDLFLEEMLVAQGGCCAWTGVRMTTDINSDRLRLITLDRLDNSRGYTKDNVVLVCKAANQARGNATPAEFVAFIDDVRG